MNEVLESLPDNPVPLLQQWLQQAFAEKRTPNPNAMSLATVSTQKGEQLPSARIVLCKHIDATDGYFVFYTNYYSRKATELELNAYAAAVFLWDAQGRQARIEGLVIKSPEAESDQYFASRSRESQIGAWASAQSEPVASRTALLDQLQRTQERFADQTTIPRPPHWGGYRLWATAVELWVQGEHRVHDRARWIRTVARDDNGQMHPDRWTVIRLQP